MLEDLNIKDFAIIDSVQLEFTKGFNVLTGETGAGKSILIGALSFLLGGKAEVSQLRDGAQEARVSGTILISDRQKEALAWLAERNIEPENNRILLRRTIKDTGKTAAWIQDTPVTKNELADFTGFLVDIHGQNDRRQLMDERLHREYLDRFGKLEKELSGYRIAFSAYTQLRKEIDRLSMDEIEKAR
ncbi:MAG: AAA family ATPase, partial [Spirochaetaceae bacterium]|nr:AAA family ATPase [Spirochaetaceae bacterium]